MALGYNPSAYVPGGSSRRKALAIQSKGRVKKRPTYTVSVGPVAPIPVMSRTPVRPVAAAAPKFTDPTLGRANSIAEQLYGPLFARLGAYKTAAENNARTAYGTHATALEQALQATAAPVAGAFDKGIASAATVNDAVANRLNNAGTAASGELAAKLAQINASPQTATDLSKFYTGASNAGFARDSADLTHLIGRRAEAESYQGKLPGIARLTANQDLQSALARLAGDVSEQERELNSAAVQTAGSLYGDFRAENLEKQKMRQQAIKEKMEIAAQERASLRALAAAAQTEAQRRMYQAQEKALDRQLKMDIANLNADVRLTTDNPPARPKPPSRTGPANQQFITVNGKVVKNPNYKPPSSPSSTNDTWETPGSAKRDRVVQSAWRAVVSPEGGWSGDLLRKLRRFPMSADAIINTAINQAMRAQGVKNPNSPSAKAIRDRIRKQLSGRTWQVEGYDEPFTFRA